MRQFFHPSSKISKMSLYSRCNHNSNLINSPPSNSSVIVRTGIKSDNY